MSAPTLDLSIVLSINERTKPILEGRVHAQGTPAFKFACPATVR